ncbi:hypothetical protein EON81_23925 [bacterium]|nr:MAG: hypothetical protein EON81_23925 [bacterium]
MKRPSPRLLVIPVAFLAPLALSHVNIVIEGIHLKGAAVDFGVPPLREGLAGGVPEGSQV